MSSVPAILGLPPGVHFSPDADELVDLYLLPRARGEPAPYHGVAVLDDDAAGSTLPEDLLDRHGRAGDLDAYFFVRGGGAMTTKPGARQDRGCGGGGATWKSQKRVVDDKARYWSKHNLNLHLGRGESGGSVGWVMHEYALTDPSFPPLKLCHVSFSGHGRNSKRVPGGRSDPAPTKRARVDAGGSASSGSGGSTTTTVDDEGYSATAQVALTGGQEATATEWIDGFLNDGLQGMGFAAPADNAEPCFFDGHVVQTAMPAAAQQVPEHLVVQDTAGLEEGLEHRTGSSGSGSTTTTVDQDYYSGVGLGSADHRAPPPAPEAALTAGQQLLEEYQYQWVDDLISDGLPNMAFAAPADAEHYCFEEQVVSQAAAATQQQASATRMVVSWEGYDIEL
ncbi:unnamed protein product [Urochloa humidicola]